MSTFDIEELEEVWPAGISKNLETVKENLLQGMEKPEIEPIELKKDLNELATNSYCDFSPQSIEFLDSVIAMQAAPGEKQDMRISERAAYKSDNCARLETLLEQLLHVILKDSYETAKKPKIEEMHQELMQLFNSMMETQAEGSMPHEYSPKLEAVLSRIAVTGLVTLDPSNNTVEFEF